VGIFATTFADVAKEYDERFRQERVERRKRYHQFRRDDSGVEMRTTESSQSDTK